MHGAHAFLQALTIVLCVAAVTTVVFKRLRQPVVLGYILAGLLIGPHIPFPLVADQNIVGTLSELGVILLMFGLGLEFSIAKLIEVGPVAGIVAVLQCSAITWLGYMVGQVFGWTQLESIFTGAAIASSSTTIIAKAFDEQKIRGPLRELVVGILIVEDLIAIFLMAVLTAVATGTGVSAGELAMTMGRLAAFLAVLLVVGVLVVPRAVRYVNRLHTPEATLVASVGICFGIALLAQEFGYSVALGAFLAGSLVAESGEARVVEHLLTPVRDMFAAIFFVSVGMMIDPATVADNWPAIVVLTLVVVVGKVTFVTVGAFLTGNSTRVSVQTAMSLSQIGEFAFIMVSLGLSLNAIGQFLYPVAVAVSAITTLTTPWLIRVSGGAANFVDRKLPRSMQTFVALYGSWLERLRTSSSRNVTATRRAVRLLIIDALLLAAIVVGLSLFGDRLANAIVEGVGLGPAFARFVPPVAGLLLAVPFALGVVRTARWLGRNLAERALPPTEGLDLASAPRRTLIVALQLAIVLVVGAPLVAITEPFVPGSWAAVVFLLLLVVLGVLFWRRAADLQGHIRAGAQAIVEVLAAQSHAKDAVHEEEGLQQIHQLLPGIGEPIPLELASTSPAVGRTLAQLDLRGATGATVLAIRRGAGGVIVPGAKEVLCVGDVLALAGTQEAIAAARTLLSGERPPDVRTTPVA